MFLVSDAWDHWEVLRNWNNVRQLLLRPLLFWGVWSIICAVDLLGFSLIKVQVLCHSPSCYDSSQWATSK